MLKPGTMLDQNSLKFIKSFEPTIDEWFVGELPQMFSRLKLWRVGRQKTQGDSRRALDFGADVVGSVVQQNENLVHGAGLNKISEFLQSHVKSHKLNTWHQEIEGAPGGRMGKGVDIQPFVARPNRDNRPLPARCPDAPQERLKTNTMLVSNPHLQCPSA